jgi:hypothetical protein
MLSWVLGLVSRSRAGASCKGSFDVALVRVWHDDRSAHRKSSNSLYELLLLSIEVLRTLGCSQTKTHGRTWSGAAVFATAAVSIDKEPGEFVGDQRPSRDVTPDVRTTGAPAGSPPARVSLSLSHHRLDREGDRGLCEEPVEFICALISINEPAREIFGCGIRWRIGLHAGELPRVCSMAWAKMGSDWSTMSSVAVRQMRK